MAANRILDFLVTLTFWLVVPAQIVTTLLLGILVSLSFGLLLLPLSLVWVLFLAPLLGLSRLCHSLPVLRNIVGVVGIPWALVANTYVCLMPSMGEVEGRAAKMLLCLTWPFTWEFWQFRHGRLQLWSDDAHDLDDVLTRLSYDNPMFERVVQRSMNGEQLDPDV